MNAEIETLKKMSPHELSLTIYHETRPDQIKQSGKFEMSKAVERAHIAFLEESERLYKKPTVSPLDMVNFNRSIAITIMKAVCLLNSEILKKPVLNETAYMFSKIEDAISGRWGKDGETNLYKEAKQ